MHTVFALLCFVVVIYWLIFPYPTGLLHWHCGNLTIAPVPAKQPWWIWINTSCEFIMNDCISTTKQSTTKPCAYFLGYTVYIHIHTFPGLDNLTDLASVHWSLPYKVINCTNIVNCNLSIKMHCDSKQNYILSGKLASTCLTKLIFILPRYALAGK